MGTKNNPGDYDCYLNAHPDEPMFVLLARDENAPTIVRTWVKQRQERRGGAPIDAKAEEALACADAMERWRAERVNDRAGASETPEGK